jgi:hypothetical protein
VHQTESTPNGSVSGEHYVHICVAINLVASILSSDFFYEIISPSKKPPANIFFGVSVYIVYFMEFGWLFSLVYVCLPAHVLSLRIQQFIDHIGSEDHVVTDWQVLMEWYDDLYEGNRKLVDLVSPIITINILFLGPLIAFLLEVWNCSYRCSFLFSKNITSHSLFASTQMSLLLA